jgi:purine-binding chemotaxis protein CheW
MMTFRQEQFIEMAIGQENYAIGIDRIREIIRMQKITVIPHSRSHIKGVIHLRGNIVPVISLRRLFGMQDEIPTKATRIIIVKDGKESVGIMVDKVTKVTVYPNIQASLGGTDAKNSGYFSGIGHNENHLVSLLNLDEILFR